MDTTTVLLATAQIAVAFAGFAGLAALLGRRQSKDDVRIDVMRLRAILEGSLSVVAVSVLPLILLSMGMTRSGTWRFCSGVYLAVSLALVIVWTSRIRGATRAGLPVNRRITGMFYGIAGLLTLLLGSNLFAFPETLMFAVYLASLYIVLLGMALLFLRLVASLITSAAPSDGSDRGR